MSDIDIRITGKAGRITLTRPKALNALSYEMCMAIDAALKDWATNDTVQLVVIDAAGDKAFCAGGDIAELYDSGTKGDYAYGRKFWSDEYRLNARMFEYGKPIVSFMQGFTMGGGVGIGCHGAHRVLCETSQISMPEVGIGLVPDVGGTLILSQAPGRLGEYLGLTGFRMVADDAILAGFADLFIPQDQWPSLISLLETDGDLACLTANADVPPTGKLRDLQGDIDRHFAGETLSDILNSLHNDDSAFSAATLKSLRRNSPLSMACTAELLHRLRGPEPSIRAALELEYRFTYRAMERGDFLEGIRAAIIDKDRNPQWQHSDMDVPTSATSQMLMPLGAETLTFEEG
ncbi:enoyl-CoA hydratase/isomerase family protein [Parasedimentitalea maritima]|uniref:3-hydroxyisobutyryl-CoA hydrolase n=1 Tax=Parasedimentitalea maritima TaxID=2578117 RepID=A0A6A4RF05_9RHOB|nr:enoyl-CoA hydratase/isomerase family protein [Zongyanglinia marina]KAE9631670.1 enoyl-CoA hydratase/isomerase family protein [Zongyanglinia marina]